jgi:hypothetical protein
MFGVYNIQQEKNPEEAETVLKKSHWKDRAKDI